ncbi:unnamed protein product, partial [Rotaria magnacalcarata]
MITTQLKLDEIWNNNLPSSSSSLTPSSSSIITLSPSLVVSKDFDCEIEILSKNVCLKLSKSVHGINKNGSINDKNIVQQIATATNVKRRT